MAKKLKTAILLTGAAARISQETALFDQLLLKKGLKVSQDDTLLVGFSSGAINVAAINACFGNDSVLDWDSNYKKQLLFPLRNSDVFKIKMLPFDNEPLRKTILKLLDKMNYHYLGELPFHSYILTYSLKEKKTLWAYNLISSHEYINLADLFMASTAIPVIFPKQEIRAAAGYQIDFPGGKYIDGGTEGSFKRFDVTLGEYVKENGQFDTMYIISPMRDKTERVPLTILKMVNNMSNKDAIISHFINHLNHISMKAFLKFLQSLNEWNYNGMAMSKNIYISIPEMRRNYNILNFNTQKEQYYAVIEWARKNPDKLAIPIDQFLKEHKKILDQIAKE